VNAHLLYAVLDLVGTFAFAVSGAVPRGSGGSTCSALPP
jgi:hypothetical protein